MKLRIVKFSNKGADDSYHVEKKFLWWWGPICFDDGQGFTDIASFKTVEDAERFIDDGCKDPQSPVREVIKYLDVSYIGLSK